MELLFSPPSPPTNTPKQLRDSGHICNSKDFALHPTSCVASPTPNLTDLNNRSTARLSGPGADDITYPLNQFWFEGAVQIGRAWLGNSPPEQQAPLTRLSECFWC